MLNNSENIKSCRKRSGRLLQSTDGGHIVHQHAGAQNDNDTDGKYAHSASTTNALFRSADVHDSVTRSRRPPANRRPGLHCHPIRSQVYPGQPGGQIRFLAAVTVSAGTLGSEEVCWWAESDFLG